MVVPSQCEMSLQSNGVSHWLGANLESALPDHMILPAVTEVESEVKLTKDIPYLTLTGELWGIYCEDFECSKP